MDLILFYYFCMLADYKNFSVAAAEVYLSQSSFSKRIKSLEEKLGTDLFVRNPRSVELTEAGKLLLPYAQNILNEFDLMKKDIGILVDFDSVLRIAAISFLSYYGITNQIMSYIKNSPEVNVGVKEISSNVGVAMMESGQIDAVLMFIEESSFDEEWDVYPLVMDEMVGIMKKGHPLAGEKNLTLRKLCTQELVIISEHDEPFFKKMILRETERAGIQPNIHLYRVWIGAIESIIKQSDSVAVLPRKVAERMKQDSITYKTIQDLPKFWFSVVTEANNNNMVLHNFIKYLATTYRE